MNSTQELVKLAVHALEDKKADDIQIIDISEISILGDYFIIASGSNKNQIQALCDHIDEILSKNSYSLKQIEGYDSGSRILMDYQDIIIHIFDHENRIFYDLERIWKDGKIINIKELS